MLTHPTHDQLKVLKLDGMAEALGELQTQDGSDALCTLEWQAFLVGREASNRATKRFNARVHSGQVAPYRGNA